MAAVLVGQNLMAELTAWADKAGVSAAACSAGGGDITERNQHTSSGNLKGAGPTPALRPSKREINELLFRRLDKILVREAGPAAKSP
jgi:hypothetical protein